MALLAMTFSSLFATNVTIKTNSTSTTWTTETDKYSGVIGNFKITCSKGTATSLGNAASSDYIQSPYLQPIITQYFIDNKSEIWLLFLIAHSKR